MHLRALAGRRTFSAAARDSSVSYIEAAIKTHTRRLAKGVSELERTENSPE